MISKMNVFFTSETSTKLIRPEFFPPVVSVLSTLLISFCSSCQCMVMFALTPPSHFNPGDLPSPFVPVPHQDRGAAVAWAAAHGLFFFLVGGEFRAAEQPWPSQDNSSLLEEEPFGSRARLLLECCGRVGCLELIVICFCVFLCSRSSPLPLPS